MDSKKRLFTKSVTWQLAGVATMTLIGLLFTRSVSASGGIAITGSLVGFFSYFLHELAWTKIPWGRVKAEGINTDGKEV
ncbi:DUF2061 domain-containing protein [Hoeflea sp. TYP-13]|uniref:DUF2061 domain-containing protein n=1 Tax=Hoeflea sp. TYP-13 TaxID=3230023 RepID=UPI0034C64694